MILVCAAALWFGACHRLALQSTQAMRFFGYFAFCLLQQVALDSYLTNRLLYAFEESRVAAVADCAILRRGIGKTPFSCRSPSSMEQQ